MQTVLHAPKSIQPSARIAARPERPIVGARRTHRRRGAGWGAPRTGFEPFVLGCVVGLGLWALLLLPLLL